MKDNFIAIRGAITVEENSKEDIRNACVRLVSLIMDKNCVEKSDITSVIFSLTDDITKLSPASAIRHAGLISSYTALFCTCEPKIEGNLPLCIRVLVNAKSSILQRFVRHVYLEGAEELRPDLEESGHFQVAIDGPSAAGKTTVAKLIADRLNIAYLDTGAIYRAVAVYARDELVDVNDEKQVNNLILTAPISLVFHQKQQIMLVDGENVTDRIRHHAVSKDASDISRHMAVREFVTKICRETAKSQSIVMEGRDICGYVLPDADIKIYLDSTAEARAKRRFTELSAKGQEVDFDTILADIKKRDENDMSRQHMPLKKTEDSIYIDATNLSVEEVFDIFLGELL